MAANTRSRCVVSTCLFAVVSGLGMLTTATPVVAEESPSCCDSNGVLISALQDQVEALAKQVEALKADLASTRSNLEAAVQKEAGDRTALASVVTRVESQSKQRDAKVEKLIPSFTKPRRIKKGPISSTAPRDMFVMAWVGGEGKTEFSIEVDGAGLARGTGYDAGMVAVPKGSKWAVKRHSGRDADLIVYEIEVGPR